MVQIQFSLMKKIKIGRPEQSLTPQPLRLITSHFRLTPFMPQSGRHVCITPGSGNQRRIQNPVKYLNSFWFTNIKLRL